MQQQASTPQAGKVPRRMRIYGEACHWTDTRYQTHCDSQKMYLAKVIGKVVSVVKHPAYQNRTLLLIQPLSLKAEVVRTPTIAVDYVGAGEGDTVIIGAGPGVAEEVFGVADAPIRELVMGIVDHFSVVREAFDNDGLCNDMP